MGIQIQQKTSLCQLSGPSLLAPSINTHTHTLIAHCSTLLHTHRANASCVLTASVAKPLVGCWIHASGAQASMSALWTQPCIWQLHGTTYKRVHLSRCSCPNQIIPGVRLIDAVCTPSHSFLWEVLAWHGLLQCVYMSVCVHTFILSKETYKVLFVLHHMMLIMYLFFTLRSFSSLLFPSINEVNSLLF